MKKTLSESCAGIQKVYVGLDVHLKSWSVTFLSDTATLKKYVQAPDPEALYARLRDNYPEAEYYSVYEAGFCGFWIHERLCELGVHNIVVNPADVPTTGSEKLRKTDAVDSRKLAIALRANQLKGIYVPDRNAVEMRSLIRLKYSIAKDISRQKNRIKSQLRFLGVDIPEEYLKPRSNWSNNFIDWIRNVQTNSESGHLTLQLQIKQLEDLRRRKLEITNAMRRLSRTERFSHQLELIMTIPGIGLMTGMAFLAEIDDVSRFGSAAQLASYIGMVPMCHSSGETDGSGDITLRRHAIMRSNLIEAAWVAVRYDQAMQQYYMDNCGRMVPSKAIVKVARKIVNCIYFVLKRDQPYVSAT